LEKLSRAEGDDSPGSRHSLNHFGNNSHHEWQAVLKFLQCHNVVSDMLASLAVDIGRTSFELNVCGGDVVKSHANTGQAVHSDGKPPSSESELRRTPWLAMSVAVHDIDVTNAPLSFWGIDSMAQHYDAISFPKAPEDVGLKFEDTLVCMSRGDIFIRNPLVWHCGTSNLGESTRYLPAMIWSAD